MEQLLLFDICPESFDKRGYFKRKYKQKNKIKPIHWIYWNRKYYCVDCEIQQSIKWFLKLHNSDFRKRKYKKYSQETSIRKIKMNLRGRLRRLIKKGKQSKGNISYSKMVGCGSFQLVKYIENKFKDGMSWNNYGYGNGKWVIDHIKPVALFDVTNPEELQKINHYTNLQPLWFHENALKSDKYESKISNPT